MDIDKLLDCREMRCPMPIVEMATAIRELQPGEVLAVEATDPAFLADARAWAEVTGNALIEELDGDVKRIVVRRGQT